ncbi:MAG: hypothetical protein AUI14_13510 [Actinobacteria bacterium 13_2_20CM_2_71_6]|nr:MAG: hypothetical protein AUI14_13510 [Actinobacteria bacterium 13_2_20CM_2_71_6]
MAWTTPEPKSNRISGSGSLSSGQGESASVPAAVLPAWYPAGTANGLAGGEMPGLIAGVRRRDGAGRHTEQDTGRRERDDSDPA